MINLHANKIPPYKAGFGVKPFPRDTLPVIAHKDQRNVDGKIYTTTTTMFRNECDLHWEKFIYGMFKRFKENNHVNVVSLGCSNGAEPYSTALLLMHTEDENKNIWPGVFNAEKFFPIKAIDIVPENIETAQNGFIELRDTDKKDIRDYTSKKYVNLFKRKSNNLHEVSPALHEKINFKTGNIEEEVRNKENFKNAPSVVFMRNALYHLKSYDKIEKVVKNLYNNLEPGSVLVCGRHDDPYLHIIENKTQFKPLKGYPESLVFEKPF